MPFANATSAREWANEKCKAWNWNCNVAEIAHELIEEGIEVDSGPFVTLGEEFVRFFGGQTPRCDAAAKANWQIIGQIMETFG
jgi:hypothetical protein